MLDVDICVCGCGWKGGERWSADFDEDEDDDFDEDRHPLLLSNHFSIDTMLRMLSSGWSSGSNGTVMSSTSSTAATTFKAPMMPPLDEDNDNDDNDDDDEGIPQFPLPGSIQRANPSAAAPSFDVSPPSPPASSSRPSTPPTPKARPSHRAFPPEGDDVLQGFSLPLPPSTKSIPPKVRRKEALKPGHSALDWARASREAGEDFRVRSPFHWLNGVAQP